MIRRFLSVALLLALVLSAVSCFRKNKNVTNPIAPYAALVRYYRERWAFHGHAPADALVGAGTAGLVTAAGAAGLGAKVALVERDLMGERRRRTEVGDRQRVLEITTGGEDLAPDRFDRVRWQPTPARRAQSSDDLRFPLGDIRRQLLSSFEVSDLKGGLCALVEEEENLIIEVVDPGAPIAQVHKDSRRPALANPAHYRGSLPTGQAV